ncbi:carbohydrate-binding protein [Algibacter lectus]|uniref:Putative secreted protein (Por secretion system target) n=1 Tax=Algibacter lectus TaxID=221126 RepID=A0A4R8MAX7_9FLAO|nr:carbohydrate-binding protein [Algibacter lectus]MWW25457.1 carbohydrate-binding protein [Algibacter lectus]TDY61402.1 putative secreted protein (Por secretion system target) [Algibacter lectus]
MKKYIQLIILPVLFLWLGYVQAQTEINSLAELKDHLGDNDGNFVMTPGTYYFNETNCGPDKLFSNPKLLLFTGNDCKFDFTDVKFEIDTKIFKLYGNTDIIEFWAAGNDNVYLNLTMEDIGMTVPSKGAGSIHLDGADNLIEGFKTTVRGSFPYGYGDTFGKGGGSVIAHQKHAGILVRGDRNHIKNCSVIMRAYGHGIFVQGSHKAIIEGCYVEGELRTVGEMLQEEGTDSPADNVDFETVWGFNLKDHKSDYTFSLQEAGIRAYSTGVIHDSNGDSTGVSRGTENTTVIDCTIVKMRVGVNTGAEGGDNKRIENCTALACEGGFWLGNDGDVINCRADASVGPILSEDISRSNASYEVTILDNYIPKIGDTPYFYAGGTNHNITIHDGTTYYNPDIKIVLGGTRPANRFLAGSVEPIPSRNANNITFTNNTPYPLVLESATDCNIFSCGPVEDNGSNNTITQLTDCITTKPCNNTVNNLQAECYDTMSGVGTREINDDPNTKEVYGIHTGDWINFNAIDLTDMTSVEAILSSIHNDVSIEVRTGSNTGTLLATIPITSTSSESNYLEFSANLNQVVNGETNIYFVFTSVSETGWLFNLDKLSFNKDACSQASYNPFLPISAEDFCASSGITVYDLSIFNKSIGDIDDGDYLRFSNVHFGNDDVYNEIEILASSTTGGSIEVRSGAVDGALLTSVVVGNTGSNDNYEIFSSYTASEITGTHDLYFVFKGTGSSFLNMDNFFFNNDECSGVNYNAFSQIDTLDYCGMFGVVPINNEYLGGINDNEWIRYGSVDFTSEAPAQITFNVAGYPTEETVENGFINVMLGHPTEGTLIAQTTVPKTGGWEVWEQVTESLLQNVTGTHEVYLYFGNGAFNLDWFEFHQETPELINLALASNGGIASQSTTDYDGDATRGNDGNTNGNYGSGSVTHTEHGSNGSNTSKWWQVDLGANNVIWEIVIYGRTGSNYVNDLNNFTVEVLNNNGDVTFTQFYENYPSSRPLTIDVDNKVGRIIKISKTSDRGLSLAEVEVYGTTTLSVSDFNLPQIILYPNPANQVLTVVNGSNLLLEIYNINGVLESKFFLPENNKEVSLKNLSTGVYFMKFTGDQGTTVKKLIKL